MQISVCRVDMERNVITIVRIFFLLMMHRGQWRKYTLYWNRKHFQRLYVP